MSVEWKSDEELFELAKRELFTAVVGDSMDKMGLVHQFLPPQVQPLEPWMRTIGRAMTLLGADCIDTPPEVARNNKVLEQSFGVMLRALDDLKPNEIYFPAGGSPRYALWGELMATRAMKLGAAGAVMNGYSRDTPGILALKFPTFSWGPYAQDFAARAKVIDFRCPLEVEGVRVNPGDIVFGDVDGVCVIPRQAEEEVFARALEKSRGEKLVGKAMEEGMSASEAFAKFGIM
ncbi:MAG TPA: RraA family protein [Bryobacterales bacterium]|nr:RraA family protein [Bryobacterales bacterium]